MSFSGSSASRRISWAQTMIGRDLVDRAADEDDPLLQELLEDPAGRVEIRPRGNDLGGFSGVGHGREASGRSGYP